MNWGDVPTWVGAGSSILALIAAAIAATYAAGIVKVERGRDAVVAEERRRSQAEFVAVWMESDDSSATGEESTRSVLRNGSELPIYDIEIEFESGMWNESAYLEVAPPTNRRDIDVPSGAPSGHGMIAVKLSFRDAAGRFWTRDFDGYLRPTFGNDPLEPAPQGGEPRLGWLPRRRRR